MFFWQNSKTLAWSNDCKQRMKCGWPIGDLRAWGKMDMVHMVVIVIHCHNVFIFAQLRKLHIGSLYTNPSCMLTPVIWPTWVINNFCLHKPRLPFMWSRFGQPGLNWSLPGWDWCWFKNAIGMLELTGAKTYSGLGSSPTLHTDRFQANPSFHGKVLFI